MAPTRLPLHAIVDGLVNLAGWSSQEAAIRSGVSPGTVSALRTHEPTQVVTWCRMAAALGCQLAIARQDRTWQVDLPRPAPPLIERSWRAWRNRRLVSAHHSIADLTQKLKRPEREERARQYVRNEETRLRERLILVRRAIQALAISRKVEGFRQAVRLLCQELAITAEELSLLAGVHLAAAQNALGEEHDGRLVTLHRLLSAIPAQLQLDLAGGGTLTILPCPPGPWKMGDREEEDPATRTVAREPRSTANRSRLDIEQILALYDADWSIGKIAAKAGISRQRVHKIAMDHGRRPRRSLAKERRIAAGQELLGGTLN